MSDFIPSKSGIALLYIKSQRLYALADELSELAVAAKDLTDGEKAFWIESISRIQAAAVATDEFCQVSLDRLEGFETDLQSFDFEN